ncbi:MAG TPA: hypothetical protein VEY09_11560 [Pyrinomonadaceae bacterium]|nr:hypothetical protein [Pyrinomonadaceae bacterium]
MAERQHTERLTAGDRLAARLFRLLPWLALLACAVPAPAYFLWRYFTVAENAGEYMLFALTSLGAGLLVGFFAALAAYALRRAWEARLRERLSRDGVTAGELKWFLREVPAERRRALREMERTHPLLAEAYRDTLAADVTAARVLAHARRESEAVGRRLAGVAQAGGAARAELERDLQKDRARIDRVVEETSEHRREIETRLQAVEAMAARDASEQETRLALLRLGSVREHAPLGLASSREESDAREEVEREALPHARREADGSGGPDPLAYFDRESLEEVEREARRLQSSPGGESG